MNTLTRQANLIYTDWTLIEPEFDPSKLRERDATRTERESPMGIV